MNAGGLQTSIHYLKGISTNQAEALKSELEVFTFQDLLHVFPNRYLDRSRYYAINQLQRNSSEVQIIGEIVKLEDVKQKQGKRLVATFQDSTGTIELVWFRGQKWIKSMLKYNTQYVVYGKINWFNGRFSLPHPDLELLSVHKNKHKSGLQPIYPSTEKLGKVKVTNKLMSNWILIILKEYKSQFKETLPDYLKSNLNLVDKKTALINIHFPKNQTALTQAETRLKFEELFYTQLQLLFKNKLEKTKFKGFNFKTIGSYFNTFYKHHLPFKLTNAQKRVIKEIRNDLGSNAQMNRLLQGDVGSGKTIVAFMSILMALDNGYQSCLMAPTEILSVQHFNVLSKYCKKLNISIELLKGSTKTSKRNKLYEQLLSGELQVLIGTHALIEDTVQFKNLGLAIIDEQHRFGVAQRSKLWTKNDIPPHILVMTATPIPRTLAMTVYGDLDISSIDELPVGRQPIKTVHRYDSNRLKVFAFLKDEIKKGRQVYIVYPLIEESEKLDLKDLMDGFESISRDFPKPKYQISIVHGRMKTEAKNLEMERFIKGKTQIMIATTVIEVGVNIPNATVMVIENAERFGLSQLHQLRGRVGRGAEQSYCILMTDYKLSETSRKRIETMVKTNNGFEIAEMDLKLRGPGNLTGTQQSGVLQLKIANILTDGNLLNQARHQAKLLLKEDPELELEKNHSIRYTYSKLNKHNTIWSYIS